MLSAQGLFKRYSLGFFKNRFSYGTPMKNSANKVVLLYKEIKISQRVK